MIVANEKLKNKWIMIKSHAYIINLVIFKFSF